MREDNIIADKFGRSFPYLRLSLTDVCNFSCSYCLPEGYKKTGCESFLSIDEITRLVKVFADLGTWKVRFTGGEPCLRKDFIDITQAVSSIPGIKKLAFTTNGYGLAEKAASYYQAGMRAVNISMDSLNAERFYKITGHDRLNEILDGIDACFSVGFKNVKLNTVLLKGLNDDELEQFINFVADKPISLRFIELMQTLDNVDYFNRHHLSGNFISEKLQMAGWKIKEREAGAGPATEFYKEGSLGTIGLIEPYSKDFCKTCNRLRVSAKGDLHLCLFGQGGISLREYLQDDSQSEALQNKILELMRFKVSGHFLHQGNVGVREHLASIGG